VSFGAYDLSRLRDSGIAGALVTEWHHISPKSAITAPDLFARISAS
jgi:hypothetical protein